VSTLRTTRAIRTSAAALGLTAAALLAGCAGSPQPAASGDGTAAAGEFPVTIEHAFGETEIPEEPNRVATWGWAAADAVLAFGVVPVAIPVQSYGGDENGVLPWIAEALAEQGAETPTMLAVEGEEPPYEQLAEAAPDVILAPYSGVTEEQYNLLTEIAPTVAYPETAWSTPWRDVIEIVGASLGKTEEATELLQDIDDTIAEQAAAHPEFAGKTLAMVADSGGKFYVYEKTDPRVEFGLDLGFESAPAVDELSTGESTFYYTLSYENLDQLESDVIVSFAATEEEQQAFLESEAAGVMPQVQSGAVATLTGPEYVAAVSPPTALSLTWGIDTFVSELSKAAQAADAG
jgi:iron complex transport system substrate-binding protein